jgi:methylated-DNA-protein-cysteine methyltransferase-like protein
MNFFEEVYKIVKQIPYGMVMTYGDIARLLGKPRASRQVGWALHVNPSPETIPCYRVVNRYGRLSPAFAFGGINRQKELLEKEGVTFDEKGCVKPCFFVSKRI